MIGETMHEVGAWASYELCVLRRGVDEAVRLPAGHNPQEAKLALAQYSAKFEANGYDVWTQGGRLHICDGKREQDVYLQVWVAPSKFTVN